MSDSKDYAEKSRRFRQTIARLFLLVYLPMAMASAMHIHAPSPAITCDNCARHVAHAAHFSIADNHFDDCVLCQFLSLSYLPAAVVASIFIITPQKASFCQTAILAPQRSEVCHSTRAPPFLL